VSYVEAHGSGTALGDPIEIEALSTVLGKGRAPEQPLLVGSVKTNVGHLAGAAGIAGLMKTVLALQHKEIPAHLHVKQLNPHVSWPDHAIAIPTIATPWPSAHETRIAGVSSFGWSGTNAHIILEEGPVVETSLMSRPFQLLLLSAKTETALEHAADNLVTYLQSHPETPLADIAHTLQTGRSRLEHRRLLVCRDREDALAVLTDRDTSRMLTSWQTADRRPVAFLFPGLGEQYVGMASELYQTEPSFRQTVDFCCTFLKHSVGLNLDDALYQKNQRQETASPNGHEKAKGNGKHDGADSSVLHLSALLGRNGHSGNGHTAAFDRLKQTVYAQPLTFIIEYALAQLLMQWGIRPQAMLGYSLGEYVAACLSGVLALEDALLLVTRRAQLIQAQPAGAMLAVVLPEQALSPYLSEQVSLAVINAPNTCVLSGSVEAIARVEQQLSQREIAYRRVETTHAFHSTMLDVLRGPLTDLARSITLHEPQIPYISDVTGTWITAEQATDPTYWVQHMCQTVRFADGVGHLLQDTEYLLLEVGPGQSLSSFVRQHPACARERMQNVFSTLPFEHERQPALAFLLATLGKLWLAGAAIDWAGFYARERRRRVPLPTYPFERQRYWLEPKKRARAVPGSVALFPDEGLERKTAITDWFYLPLWKQAVVPPAPPIDALLAQKQCWVVFTDDCGIGSQVVDQLLKHGQDVLTVVPGSFFDERGEHAYSIRPDVRADYAALFKALRERGQQFQQIVHLWTVTASIQPLINSDQGEMLKRGFYSLLALAQALGDVGLERCAISVVSNEVHDVIGSESLCPEKSTIAGPCRVIPQEYPNITCRSIDICLSEAYEQRGDAWIRRLMEELVTDSAETIGALRGNRRWVQTFEPLQLPERDLQTAHLRAGGVYLITGGLGGIGLAVAAYLARTVSAKLVLVGRAGLPSRHEWKHILESQGEATGVGRQIRKMLDLEALGAKVLVMRADVSDEAQMQAVVQQASAMFGTIHGVFHAAGVPGAGLIQLKTPEQAARVLLPKVQGTLTLERSLQSMPLDFLVLFSSITSTIGSPGQVDYCAANAFLDSFARSRSHDHGMTIAIDWSEWQWNAWEEGMAGYGELGTFLKENRQRFGLTFEEGVDALKRALTSQKSQIVVSTQDFNNVVALSKSFTVTALLQEKRQDAVRKATHLRPALGTSYVAPRNELERTIAALWEQLLAIEQVGINDNFFDLGGNSLLGTELIASMKKALHVEDLPAYVLYEAPSVDAMARYLEQSKTAVPAEKTHERSERRRESLKQRMRETRRAR
jgi:acyl transferase domain-containing protein